MPVHSAPITTLHNLLDFDAAQCAIAEIQLKTVLPGWINAASALKLKTILQKYLDIVRQHAQLMEGFFEEEQATAGQNLHNRVMQAFIDETWDKLSRCRDMEVKDACLLACIQEINHFKISTYGTAASFANALGLEKQAGIFHQAEVNEKQVDDRLSQLAEHEINSRAKTPIVLPDK